MKSDNIKNILDNIFFIIPTALKSIKKEFPICTEDKHKVHVLSILKHNSDINMTSISKTMGLPKSNLTSIVNDLVKTKMVIRVSDELDRRLIYLRITDLGLEFLAQKYGEVQSYAKEKIKSLSENDIQMLDESIENIIKILGNLKED